MMYFIRELKNGKQRGLLEFRTGKKLPLNPDEVAEFEHWLFAKTDVKK